MIKGVLGFVLLLGTILFVLSRFVPGWWKTWWRLRKPILVVVAIGAAMALFAWSTRGQHHH